MAAYIGVVFNATMALAAMIIDVAFSAAGLVPKRDPNIRAEITTFAIDSTFWLNLAFGALSL